MRLVAVLLLVACSSKADSTVSAGSGQVEVVRDDMPDDAWKEAAVVVGKKWGQSMLQRGVTRLRVKPWQNEMHACTVPYLFDVVGEIDGKQEFHGTALISKGEMLNSTGAKNASLYLGSLGFPKTQIDVVCVAKVLTTMKAVEGEWDENRATLQYTKDGATLVLLRDQDTRLVVSFAPDATFTTSK